MNQLRYICIGLLSFAMLGAIARADTFQLSDGQTLTGDVISYDQNGLMLRLPDDKYSDRIPWTKFSQDDLKKLAQNPKIEPLASPFIEVNEEDRVKKTEVNVTQPERLKRPAPRSLFGAMLASPVGFFVLVILYAAGIYAGYEVAKFRRRPAGLVAGLAAIPLLGYLSPIIFLAMPETSLPSDEGEEFVQPPPTAAPAPAAAPGYTAPGASPAHAATQSQTPAAAGQEDRSLNPMAGDAAAPSGLKLHTEEAPAAAPLPQTEIFQRGAYMFNRRFFETKFPGFFGVVRRDADKDMVLLFKAARGEYVAERISRIAAADLHVQVRKGEATEEIMIPFTEIKEVHLKHKNA